jgi:transcriptional regulator with XRE-family HTH domain
MYHTPEDCLGGNLKAARRRVGYTQADLSKASGVSAAEVSRLEAGLRNPRLTTILRLATALDMEGSELIRGARLGDGHSNGSAAGDGNGSRGR